MIESPVGVAAVLAMAAAAAFLAEAYVPVVRRLGAALLAIAAGALLSNTGLVPATSSVYDFVAGPVTMVSIGLLLLSVDLRDVKRVGMPMLKAFGLAVAGTAAGALIAGTVFRGMLPDAWRLGGTLAASYTGGAVNFVSVGRGLELPELLFTGTLAADALLTATWMAICLVLPAGARPASDREAYQHGSVSGITEPDPPFVAGDAASLTALALFLYLAAEMAEPQTGVPSVLWLTTFALVAGHTLPLKNRQLGTELGSLGLHYFFVVIGVFSRVADIAAVGLPVFLFVFTVVAVHGLAVLGLGRWLGIGVPSLAVASQAAVGGPSTALAIAVGRGWKALVLPGVLVGLLGYALGTYLGFGLAYLLRVVV